MMSATETPLEQLEGTVEVLLRKNRELESRLARERERAEGAEEQITVRVIEVLTRVLRRSNCYLVHLGDPANYRAMIEQIVAMTADLAGFQRITEGVWRLDDALREARYPSPHALTFTLQTDAEVMLRSALFEYTTALMNAPRRGVSHRLLCLLGNRNARDEEAAKREAENVLQHAEMKLCRLGREMAVHYDLVDWAIAMRTTACESKEALQTLLLPALTILEDAMLSRDARNAPKRALGTST